MAKDQIQMTATDREAVFNKARIDSGAEMRSIVYDTIKLQKRAHELQKNIRDRMVGATPKEITNDVHLFGMKQIALNAGMMRDALVNAESVMDKSIKAADV